MIDNDRKTFLIETIRHRTPEYIAAILPNCTRDEISLMAFELGCYIGEHHKIHGSIPQEMVDDAEAKMKEINSFHNKPENPVLGWLTK